MLQEDHLERPLVGSDVSPRTSGAQGLSEALGEHVVLGWLLGSV